LAARAKGGLRILSIVTTWALENAVDTADSMASRGYGTGRRTAYSDYRLSRRDLVSLVFVAAGAVLCVTLVALGAVGITFFPRFDLVGSTPALVVLAVCWAAVCAFPLLLDLMEDAVWHWLTSRI
jgi:energy-coupling factor transport system permease protein